MPLRVPEHIKSYAHLRTAQSFLAENNPAGAKAEYERIRTNANYPAVHRSEADVCIHEIDRAAQGLAAHDPLASRTQIAALRPGAEFFVAPDGSDANPGTAAHPFATLAKARAAVRALKANGLPAGGVAVTIKPGEYAMTETFALTAEDGGTEQSPIVYRAETKGAAVFYGGSSVREVSRR